MKTQVEISITKLTSQVNDGMRKKEISEYYNIPEFQVGKMLKQAGLKIRKIHAPAFVLVNDKVSDISLDDFTQQEINQTFVKDKIVERATPSDMLEAIDKKNW